MFFLLTQFGKSLPWHFFFFFMSKESPGCRWNSWSCPHWSQSRLCSYMPEHGWISRAPALPSVLAGPHPCTVEGVPPQFPALCPVFPTKPVGGRGRAGWWVCTPLCLGSEGFESVKLFSSCPFYGCHLFLLCSTQRRVPSLLQWARYL